MLTGFICKKCGCKKVYARLVKHYYNEGVLAIAIRCNNVNCLTEYVEDLSLLGIENNFDIN